MGWTNYKGMEVPVSSTGDAGGYLTSNFQALADRTSGTTGSVLFVGATGFATQDNANFFYDDTNIRLGLGTAAPSAGLHIMAATPTLLLEDTSFRTLQITGPTGGNASIALGSTGDDLDISTSTTGGGFIVFSTTNAERVRIASNGTWTTLNISGSISTAVATHTAAYTLAANDSVVRGDATGGAFTLTLPTAVGCSGRQYLLKKIDSSANAITIATTSSQTIDGAATYALGSLYANVLLISDGSNWMVF